MSGAVVMTDSAMTNPRRTSSGRPSSGGGERRTFRILPGFGAVEAILELPWELEIDQVRAALNELQANGWTLDVEAYSRLRGSYHHVGLTRGA